MRPLLAIDAEYARSNEAHMGLVSCDLCTEGGKHAAFWLYEPDAPDRQRLVDILTKVKDTHMLVSHNVASEAACLLALGLNPREFAWFDTMLEYRQLQNNNVDWSHGWTITGKGPWRKWVKTQPKFPRKALLESDETFGSDREKLAAKYNPDNHSTATVSSSLVDALKNLLGYESDIQNKEDTRGLILERKPVYSAEEQAQILAYGGQDTERLIPLARALREKVGARLAKGMGIKYSEASLDTAIAWRGRSAANVACYTRNGMPINRRRWENLISQKKAVREQAIQTFAAKWQNLWEYDPRDGKYKSKTDLKDAWAVRLSKTWGIKWPKTKEGHYSMSTADGQPLQQYRDIVPEILDFCRLTELESGLKAHADEEETKDRRAGDHKVFADYLGDDDFVRSYFNGFGTQTGRNAPAATGFIPAQAGWLRGLIDPPEGWVICEKDYSSQESWIAAVMSGDPKLIQAYLGGDPYLAFAISAGAAPANATKKTHGDIRNLFKATVLGLQYGMGAAKLAIKLTADTGKVVSEDKARELIQLHRQVYWVYYEWKDEMWAKYREAGRPLVTQDGWYLDTDSPSKMSVLNFPVQGAGSVMMRHFIDLLLDAGVRVVCPVHDSVIYMCRVEDQEQTHQKVQDAMIEASIRTLGREGMRVGAPDVVNHGEYWETEKNAAALAQYRKYFESAQATESWLDKILRD